MPVYPVQPPEPNNGRHLLFRVNGHPDIVYEVKHFWTKAPVPAGYLKRGRNVIEGARPGARDAFQDPRGPGSFPEGRLPRSAGPAQPERTQRRRRPDMERHEVGRKGGGGRRVSLIRLRLQASVPEGWLESPVIDPATGGAVSGLLRPVEIRKARLTGRRRAARRHRRGNPGAHGQAPRGGGPESGRPGRRSRQARATGRVAR